MWCFVFVLLRFCCQLVANQIGKQRRFFIVCQSVTSVQSVSPPSQLVKSRLNLLRSVTNFRIVWQSLQNAPIDCVDGRVVQREGGVGRMVDAALGTGYGDDSRLVWCCVLRKKRKYLATHADILKRVRLLIQRLQHWAEPVAEPSRNARTPSIAPGKLFAQSSGQCSPTLC